MYSAAEKRLLSTPIANLGLPALIEPTEFQLMEREAELGWDRDAGIGELLFLLRINGVAVVFINEISEFDRRKL